jgi:hypothetical protein
VSEHIETIKEAVKAVLDNPDVSADARGYAAAGLSYDDLLRMPAPAFADADATTMSFTSYLHHKLSSL